MQLSDYLLGKTQYINHKIGKVNEVTSGYFGYTLILKNSATPNEKNKQKQLSHTNSFDVIFALI